MSDIWQLPPTEAQKASIERLCKSLGVDDYIKDPPHTRFQARGMVFRLLKRLEERDNSKYLNHAQGRKEPSLKVQPAERGISGFRPRIVETNKPMLACCLVKWGLKEKQTGVLVGIPSDKHSVFTPMTFDSRLNARTLKKSIFEPMGIQTQVIKVVVKIEEIYSRG